ncbi:2'-5' RNA ligase [Nocardiopsis sp. CNR-923]|uniref:RNA 2',3'-cyclic phosphodiesterase n=1 Tax=Nocardiopsis sp. CNR-923 TaxID=1904965 RepID=UPI00095C41C5|nr:RNA 2',3'-cyclic phosphodiesterase [Nocardiopsis sp. CNR-923]OLT29739.1 2'-5' RNA ligase [Nocardiopsis sp. CNR-923]
MRLFVALNPSTEVLRGLGEAVDRGRSHGPPLRWTRGDGWHLTLVFLGEVADERLPLLTEAIGGIARAHRPLSLALEGWGRFPPRGRRSSVLWAGVTGDLDALDSLAHGMRSAARAARIHVERRPYVPHVTVARSRPPSDLAEVVEALGDLRGNRWWARYAHLIESRPGSADHYRTVQTWALGWEADSERPPELDTP